MSFNDFFEEELELISSLGRRRKVEAVHYLDTVDIELEGQCLVSFASNSYLGLHVHEEMKAASSAAVASAGTSSASSRLITGSLSLTHELEEATARWKGSDAALVFNTGYQANISLLQCILDKKTLVLADRLIHASLIDGVKLSGAAMMRYAHNDMRALEALLVRYAPKYKKIMLLSETVFSMDGDLAPLNDLADLAEKYGAFLYLDDAHGAGVYGSKGQGPAECVSGRVDVLMGTYSKGLGSFGAYACVSEVLREYLINTSRGFIFTTALPPAVVAANLKALELVQSAEIEGLRRLLRERALDLREFFRGCSLSVLGQDSPIIPIVVGDEARAMSLSASLRKAGFLVPAIRPPTVPQGECRLRLTLSAKHEQSQIDQLKQVFIELLKS
jgi:8-amino-7-oxononanoate synthase